MRKLLIEILKNLESAIPPPNNCHHAITYAQYGSDEVGWKDALAVQINQGGIFHCFFIEEGDLDGSPTKIASDIAALHKRNARILARHRSGATFEQLMKQFGIAKSTIVAAIASAKLREWREARKRQALCA